MRSLDSTKCRADMRPASAARVTSPVPSGAEAKVAGGHCQTLAEDLAYGWQELQDRFQALAPHIRQVGVPAERNINYGDTMSISVGHTAGDTANNVPNIIMTAF